MSKIESKQTAVLIVESDEDDLATLRHCIATAGFHVIEARGVSDALGLTETDHPDLVVSEIVLSDGSGFSLSRQLRSRAPQPLPILLTSHWSRESDRILAFECGADDFIAKPFFPRELASRVRAIMRRTEALKLSQQRSPEAPHESLLIDHDRHVVTLDDKRIPLTLQEFALLSVMANRRGHVFSRDELIGRAWQPGEQPNVRSVDAHVKGLRRKLKEYGRAIETVRGIGYRYTENGLWRPEIGDPAESEFAEAPIAEFDDHTRR